MLAGTPYENKKIFLTEDPNEGVIVRVDNEVYEGVDAVPEGEIKKIAAGPRLRNGNARQEISRRRQTV